MPAAERAAHELLCALGVDLPAEHLRDTPRRMARVFAELLPRMRSLRRRFPTTRATTSSSSPTGSRFSRCASTTCSRSRASPTSPICPASGSSGCQSSPASSTSSPLPSDPGAPHDPGRRVAREGLAPKGVGVVIEAEHLCMSLRGVQKPGGARSRPRCGAPARRSPHAPGIPVTDRRKSSLTARGRLHGSGTKRREGDSNPRTSFPVTRFPVVPVQPLRHLSRQSGRKASVPPRASVRVDGGGRGGRGGRGAARRGHGAARRPADRAGAGAGERLLHAAQIERGQDFRRPQL